MPTYLDNHFKIQQLESRLNKNEYMSNQCLPNFIDAQVFKALKESDKIPKRDIYPNFYHWYILMRQFADRTLEIWLKNHEIDHLSDQTICEVIRVIHEVNRGSSRVTRESSPEISAFQKRQRQNIDIFLGSSGNKQSATSDISYSPKNYIQLPKVSSHIEKKSKNQYDSVTQYIMDIKIDSDINVGFENVQKYFEIQTVKLQSIKIVGGSYNPLQGYHLRVFFMTVSYVCEDLKNKILRCSNVERIQCKKHKRNHSL